MQIKVLKQVYPLNGVAMWHKVWDCTAMLAALLVCAKANTKNVK